MITKGDKILIGLVIVISILAMFFIKNMINNIGEKYVVIKVDGEEYKKIQIIEDMEPKEIAVKTDFGYNLVEVDSEGVRVVEASCKDKLDVKQGKIKSMGEILVCLPNRLTVEIVGNSTDTEVDRISR